MLFSGVQLFCGVVQLRVRWSPKRSALLAATRDTTTTSGTGGADGPAAAATGADLAVSPTNATLAHQGARESEDKHTLAKSEIRAKSLEHADPYKPLTLHYI